MAEAEIAGEVSSRQQLPVLSPRVAFVTNVIPPYHKPMLDLLSRRYPHFRILLSTPMEPNRPWRLEWEGLNVVIQKTVTLNGRWRHPKGFSEPLYLHLPIDTVAQLSRFKADVVISGEMGIRTILAALYKITHRRTSLIVWAEIAESTEQGRGITRGLVRRYLHRAVDAFLITGKSGMNYLRNLGVPEQKLWQIAYSTDIGPFLDIPLHRQSCRAHVLLYVGQLIERKGLRQFVAALSVWAARNPARQCNLLLVGDGPLRSALELCAVPANVNIQLIGSVAYRDLPDYYERAGIFVLPSTADTWGVVANEAMAAGLPVLGSSYAQAVAELVDNGQNGWTFRPDVREEMLSAIEQALNTSEEELHVMRARARETAERYTPDSLTAVVTEAIDTCFDKRQPRAAP